MEKDLSLKIDISKFKVASNTDQIMLVIPETTTSHQAKFYYYIKNKNTNKWEEFLVTDCNIGKAGLGKQIEGDMKTPTGVYQFDTYFGIYPNPGTNLPYIQLNESLYWDCDNNSPKYNQLVNIETYKDFDTKECEHLIDETLAYQYAMNLNYNEDRIPYKGAGIFLHCYTKGPYTGGCVALPENNMIKVLKIVNENARIIIDYMDNIYNY